MLGEQFLDVGRRDISDRLVPDVGIDLVLGGAFLPVIGRALHLRKLIHPKPILHALFQRFPGFIPIGDLFIEVLDILSHLRLKRFLFLAGKALALGNAKLILVPHHSNPASI